MFSLWFLLCLSAQAQVSSRLCETAKFLTFDQADRRAVKRGSVTMPPRAREIRLQGVVRIETCVSETGDVILTKLISGHPILVPVAVKSASEWRFEPLVVSGRPVPFTTVLEIWFTQGSTPAQIEDQFQYILAESQCRDSLQANRLDDAVHQCAETAALAEKLSEERRKERRIAHGLAGRAFFAQRKFDAALVSFRRALEIASKSLQPHEAELASAHYDVARAYHASGNAKDAKGHYEQAERILLRASDQVASGSLKDQYAKTLESIRSDYEVLLKEPGLGKER